MFKENEMRLKLDQITIDGGTQPRTEISQPTVREYTEALMEGAIFPAVDVFFDGINYYLADGYHRYFAHKYAVVPDIEVKVRNGTQREAVLFSVGANAKHGLKRNNEDKRKAILILLEDPEWVTWSDRDIARACHVTHNLVSKIRTEIGANEKKKKYKTKHGTEAVMDTTKIGKSKSIEAEEVVEDIDEDYDKVQELEVINRDLKEEIQTLSDKLTVVSTGEDSKDVENLIADLRKQINALEAENDALRSQLGVKMNQNAELMRQVAYYKKRLEKASA